MIYIKKKILKKKIFLQAHLINIFLHMKKNKKLLLSIHKNYIMF